MKTTRLFFLGITLIALASCAKEELLDKQSDTSSAVGSDPSVEYKNKLLKEYAITLAKAVEQKSLRAVIKKQAVQKFDGDYDVLVNRLESEYLLETKGTVKQLMSKQNGMIRLRSTGSEGQDSAFLDISAHIPNVQVSVPVHCEEWNTSTFVPMVAVLPYDYKEKVGNVITAYDAEGNAHQLSADEEPDFPILVVGRSERVDENGNLDTAGYESVVPKISSFKAPALSAEYPEKLILTHGSAKSLLLEWTDVVGDLGYEIWRMSGTTFVKVAQTTMNDNNYVDANLTPNQKYWYKVRAIQATGYSSWSPVMATTASNRSDNEWLKIKRMKFSSSALNAVEGWISGAPEIRLRVVQGSEGGATNVFTSGILEPKKRGDINNSWWNREVTIFAWSTNVYGTVLTFDWREEDWLEKVDFPLSGSYEDKESGGTVKVGGTVQVKNDPGGDVIGNTSVMWWQEKSQVYDLSGFQWQFVY